MYQLYMFYFLFGLTNLLDFGSNLFQNLQFLFCAVQNIYIFFCKRISFSINPKYKLYTFRKVNLAYFRLKNRTIDYEQEVINISLEKASITAQTLFQNKTEYKGSIDLDSELQSFINPDTLVLELKEAMENEALATKNALENAQNAILEEMANIKSNQSNEDENDDEVVDEIVEYVDEDGNPIDVEENDLEYENLEEKDE